MSDVVYENILTKGYYSALKNTPIEDDKIRATRDTNQLFIDFDGERREITDFIKGMTEEEIRSVLAPLPKFYFASDTKRFLIFDNDNDEWIIVAEKNSNSVGHANNADTATYANSAGTATNADTATYSKNAGTASKATNADTATYAKTATNASTASFANKATNADTSVYSKNAGTASKAINADTATYATSADNANSATNADTATYAVNASTATYSKNAGTASYATKAGSATKATQDVNGKQINTTYAPLASPVLTGTPTVPTPSTDNNSKQIANTEYVTTAITNAIAGVTQFDTFVSVSLPETGKKGVIYFIPEIDSKEGNLYIEYLWVDNKFEKIGSTKIDLSGYVNSIETTGTGNAITSATISNGKITYTKGSTFLTKHPSITTSSSTASASPSAGGTVTAIDELTVDTNGHVTSFKKKTITLPNSVSKATNADTATYSKNAGTASKATNADTATYASSAGSAGSATKATQDASGNNITDTYIKNATVSGKVVTFTRGNGTTFTITTQDTNTNTTYANMKGSTTAAAGTAGLVPAPATGANNRYLRCDGTWTVPPDTNTNTTYAVMKGSTTSAAGAAGLAPAPATGANNRYLRCDGTWQVPPDNNTVYTHPTSSGNKHIPSGGSAGQILRWSADGTAAWGADNNTTYGTVTTGAAGLCPARNASTAVYLTNSTTGSCYNRFLRGDGTWAEPIAKYILNDADIDFGDIG